MRWRCGCACGGSGVKGNLYTLSYAAVIGLVCASLLTGAGWFTKPYREANAKAEEVRNILDVLGVPYGADASSSDLLEMFKNNVRLDADSGDIDLYVYGDSAVAVRFSGPGLWGPIKGFLSLRPDMRTIRGITFYEQEETPGLGGEIGSDWFRGQFVGKRIVDEAGRPGIRIVRSRKATKANEVDAITGATMTSEKVEAMLNATIELIVSKERIGDGE